MSLTIEPKLKDRYFGIKVLSAVIYNVQVKKTTPELEEFKVQIYEEAKKKYKLEILKDEPIISKYRDFFWDIGIDPTKIRPASEALIRRILQGKPLPIINTVVDAYNLASVKTHIPIGLFDNDTLQGELKMRFAEKNEPFHGIGMNAPIKLKGLEIVLSDDEKLVAVYPYRDSDATKITLDSKNILALMCGAPGVEYSSLKKALEVTMEYVTRFCGGTIK